jgi:hypothetical protein
MVASIEGPAQVERDLYTVRSAGFAVIRDFIDGERAEAILDEASPFQEEVDAYRAGGGEVLFLSGWPLRNARALYAVSPLVQDLVMDPRLVEYARGYLGNAWVQDAQLLTNMPDERNVARGVDAAVNYHRDGKWPDGDVRPMYLHGFIMLTDMTCENGGTIVVPGTHREREPGYYFKETDPGEFIDSNFYPTYPRRYFPGSIQVEAPRGSLLLIDPMVIHAQGINVSTERRTVVNVSFSADGAAGFLDCRGLARKRARVDVRPDLLELLLTDSALPDEYGPLRDGS